MASQSAMDTGTAAASDRGRLAEEAAGRVCPACDQASRKATIEKYGRYELSGCDGSGLQFWEPREMPDARCDEQMYGGRDEKLLPLEPRHKYFLADPLPSRVDVLDIGCRPANLLSPPLAFAY